MRTNSLCSSERRVTLALMDCHAIECGHQDTDGARIKDIIAEKVAHFGASDAPSRIRMHETAAVADRVATFIESSVTEKPS
jgi:hypothetical protein